MINIATAYSYCCEDISLIENYQQAIDDKNETWQCHHRLEVHGDIILSAQDLKDNDLYYNRPAYELIFLTKGDHLRLHNGNKSENTKNKFYNSMVGRTSPRKGVKLSNDIKDKISNKMKGHKGANTGKKKVWNDESHTKFHYE